MDIPVGTYTTKETHEVTRSWETASNYTKYRVDAGATGEIRYKGYWFVVRVPATQIEEFYVNRVFTASSVHKSNEEKPGHVGHQWTEHSIPALIDEGLVELNDQWEVVECGMYSDGRVMRKIQRVE